LVTRVIQPDATKVAPAPAEARYTIAVLTKAFDLLDAIAELSAPILSELSDATGQNRPTTLRILSNLVARGYAERDREGRYRLSVKLLQLGSRAAAGIDLRTLARPVMEELHGDLQETINLAIPTDQGIVYIDILESERDLRMAAKVGMRDAFHSSALGKAMLSRFPESRVGVVVGPEPLPQKTGKTLLTIAALRRDVARVRELGYAIDDEENEPGSRCLAAPLIDQRGACIGAISVSGPSSRVTPDRLPGLGARIRDAADMISRRLGYLEFDEAAAQ
jgi:IclR family acetate operon transcriptional repressor